MTTIVVQNTSWGASWSQINAGLPGVGLGVNSLTIDPASPSTIYAQTLSSPVGPALVPGLFKTTDGGESWGAVSSVAGVTTLAIDPKNSSTIYAGTNQGVVKSTNGGENWIDAGNGLPSGFVRRLAIDPITPSTLYAVSVSTAPIVFVNGPIPGPPTVIFKSTNGGGNWNALETGLPPNAPISLLVIDPVTPSTIYAAASLGEQPGGSLLKSMDGGQSWNALDTGLSPPPFINSLVVDPVTSSTLYAVSAGILKSTDGGESWNALTGVPSGLSIGNLVIDPTSPSTLYATVMSYSPSGPAWGILKSTDGGEHWNSYDNISLSAGASISSLVLDPITPSRIYMGLSSFGSPGGAASGGVLKSTDGGQSWNAANAGLVGFDVRTVALSPLDASTVYAGGFGGAFQSVDGGANWSVTGLSAYTGSLVTDPVNPGILYAQTGMSFGCDSSERFLFKSTDGGANWNDSISPLNSGCILNVSFSSDHAAPMVIDPANPNTLYVGESDDMDGYSGLLKSTDGGANWSVAWDWFNGLRGIVKALAIDPAHSATLYAGLDDVTESHGLFKSTDGGATWSNTGFTEGAVNLLAIDPAHSLIVYAAAAGAASAPTGFQGLFKSADGGATWLGINQGLAGLIGTPLTTATALILDGANTNILYLGTSNGGVFRSIDGGANWSPLNDGLTNLQIRALAVAPMTPRTVYAATPGGVFRIVDE